MSNILSDLIDQQGWCVADGATGTNLFGRGLETGYPPELWSVERPDDILWLHGSFLEAGSDLILTNSFGGTGFRLKLHESQERVRELNIAASNWLGKRSRYILPTVENARSLPDQWGQVASCLNRLAN